MKKGDVIKYNHGYYGLMKLEFVGMHEKGYHFKAPVEEGLGCDWVLSEDLLKANSPDWDVKHE